MPIIERWVVESFGDQFVIRDTETGNLVIDGVIPLMRSTKEAAEDEVAYLVRLHTPTREET